jgi:hypothetical protein
VSRRLRLAPILALLWSTLLCAAEPPAWLLGDWVLNSEKTHELQPEQRGGAEVGFGSPSISVGGVGIPLPGGGGAAPAGSARDPKVLRCDAMTVAMVDANVHFAYQGSGEELMKPGNVQGRRTSWNQRRLTQKYTTTSRSVSKTYELDDAGTLLVRVKFKPKGSKSATHIRVFERPSG